MRTIQTLRTKSEDSWVSAFLDSMRSDDLSPVTVRGYNNDLSQFLHWFSEAKAGARGLQKLTVIDLINYRQHLVNVQALKPATVNRRLEALRRFCRWAHQTKRLKTNIALELKPMRIVRNTCPVGLNEPEVHALLRVAGETGHGLASRNYALVQLFLQTGLRVGEVAGLQISDVTVRDRSGIVRIRQGKGLKAREVPLNATARRALRLYIDGRSESKPHNSFFVSDRGGPMPIRTIQSVITQLSRRAKITRVKVSVHTLRHTFALNYIRQNAGKLVELSQLLGHESLDTTAIYTRPSTESLAEDLERSRLNVYG